MINDKIFVLFLHVEIYSKKGFMTSLPKHLLYPADIFVDKSPHIVSTVLGSCVSVCLYDPMLMQGGINHFILPHWNGNDLATMKYGNLAIIRVLEELLILGSKYENVVAKVYGGAEVLSGTPTNFQIGKRNAQIAFEILNEFRIPVLISNVGGNNGRKIIFNTYTGEVEHNFIRHMKEENKNQKNNQTI